MMKDNTLRELFLDELRDLYDAENRIVKALPKMVKAAESEELRSGFEQHLEQTKGHVERLKQILTSLDEKASGKKCPGMVGILEEGEELMDEDYEGSVKDAALISAAQRVEHYEIAAYGCVHAWAEELGENEAAELLEKTLTEEKETDAKLTELAQQINTSANEEEQESEEGESEEEQPETTTARRGRSRSANA
ncbi:MAG TPA: ferritin-like domain-containing protein [Candidatus Sulfotelmatobacter sp.]|nr:ferritin-like domain-containing protein [Candidatus Sulfotelmatobacter sp.]